MSLPYTLNIDLLTGVSNAEKSTGVTTSTTGIAVDISQRQQVIVQFLATNISAGNGVFSLDGSNDGTHWTTGLACMDTQATGTTTYVTSKTLSSNSSAAVKVPTGWRFIRGVCTVTTDGTYFAFMEAAG